MKIRKQTFALSQYLKLMKNETIRTDQECQRLSGQWNANMVNELIATVLNDGYIPPVILGSLTDCSVQLLFQCSVMEMSGSQRIWMNTW